MTIKKDYVGGDKYYAVDHDDENVQTLSTRQILFQEDNWKEDVIAATTANISLSTDAENGDVIDGITLVTGDRVLIKDQTLEQYNGIFTVNASGSPTRSTDFNASGDVNDSIVTVKGGTVNSLKTFRCVSISPVVDTDDILFQEVEKISESNYLKITTGADILGATTPKVVTVGSDSSEETIASETGTGTTDVVSAIASRGFFFTTGEQNEITKITTSLRKNGTTYNDITMGIYAVDGSNKPTGNELGSTSLDPSTFSSSFSDEDFIFSTPANVEPNTTYCFVLEFRSGTTDTVGIEMSSSGTNRLYYNGYDTDPKDPALWGVGTETGNYTIYGQYNSATGLILADKDVSYIDSPIGFVNYDVISGNDAIVISNGKISGFSGLTVGKTYYLDNIGAISTTGTIRVGHAISTTELLINI